MSLFSLALTCPVFRRVQWNSRVLFLGGSGSQVCTGDFAL